MPNRPQPVLHPGTGAVGPDDLSPLFPMDLILQEVSTDAEIAIPDAVRDVYRLWRPTPLYRALRLEQALGTRSRIFYKYEGTSPAGSHKPNTATAQAYYVKGSGRTRIATETGAGQWGSAVALATQLFGLECKIYMVKVSYEQKPYRRSMMEAWGASVVASPSEDTNSGRAILAADPTSPGSLGIAISEAVEDAAQREDTAYSLGSVLNHVLMHQTVIRAGGAGADGAFGRLPRPRGRVYRRGLQLRRARVPLPAREDRRAGDRRPRLRAGRLPDHDARPFAYDFGDASQLTPLVPMHTLGHDFVRARDPRGRPPLPRRGAADLAARPRRPGARRGLRPDGRLRLGGEVRTHRGDHPGSGRRTRSTASCRRQPPRTQKAASARSCSTSGHGHFDLGAYDAYLHGQLEDYELPEDEIAQALAAIEPLPKPAGVS